MIGPEGYLDSLKGVSDGETDNVALFLVGVAILVGDLLLDPLDDADDVDHLALRTLVLMLPAIILELVPALHRLVLDLVDLVLLVLEPDLRRAFDLLPVEQLNPLHEIDPSLTQLLGFLEGRAACQVDAHQLALGVDETEVQEGHRALFGLLAAELDPDQTPDEVSRLACHDVLEG